MDTAKRQALLFLLIGATAILPAAARAADAFPNRPIRLVVPYPPGGGTDIVARVLGEKLGARLGQPIVVDNRGGAGGVLGTEIAAKAAPDGYTLLLVPSSHVINPSIYAKLPYDTVADFAPITMVASAAILMAVNPHVPADTVRGFVEAAKANPKALGNYGSAGVGTVFHLTGQLFNQLSGLSLQHVPYRGGRCWRVRFRLRSKLFCRYSRISEPARYAHSPSQARGEAPRCLRFRPLRRPAFQS
jgi:tripartite-type tricarboxylate transporter receptor subunit TctC